METVLGRALPGGPSKVIEVLNLDSSLYQQLNNQDPETGDTIFHLAVQHGASGLTALFLALGLDGTLQNKKGLVPRALCAQNSPYHRPDVVKLFKLYDKFGIVGLITLFSELSDLNKDVVGKNLMTEYRAAAQANPARRETRNISGMKKPPEKYQRTPQRERTVEDLFSQMMAAVKGEVKRVSPIQSEKFCTCAWTGQLDEMKSLLEQEGHEILNVINSRDQTALYCMFRFFAVIKLILT